MSGHTVAWNENWASPQRRPVIHLQHRAALLTPFVPAFVAVVRVAMGAGIGAMFGAATGNHAFWTVSGLVVGAAFAHGLARRALR